jgi:hypothetical protein
MYKTQMKAESLDDAFQFRYPFLPSLVKSPVKLPKMCRSQKIGFVGMRLSGVC